MNIIEKGSHCPICGSSEFRPSSAKSLKCGHCGFEWFMNASAAYVALIVNNRGELLVERRRNEPAKGTLDLPGGFADAGETAEEGIRREVKEETRLDVRHARYLFSRPNSYNFSGIDIPTLDLFFRCEVEDLTPLEAHDDAAEVMWIPINEVQTELFGLKSIREGLRKWLSSTDWK